MDNLNIVVKFKLVSSADVQVRCAARMKIDGGGAVLLYDANGRVDRVDVGQMETFTVESLSAIQTAFAA